MKSANLPVTCVANSLIPDIFMKVVPFLELGREYWEERYSLNDFLTMLYRGNMQLWVAIEDDKIKTVMLTQIIVYPRSKWIRLWYIGGSRLKDVMHYLDNVEAWGQAHGAVGFEAIGRPVWRRILSKYGFSEWNMILIKKFKAHTVN